MEISPHYDGWRIDRRRIVPGMRKHLTQVLIENCPKNGQAKAGYLAALYAITANWLPGAYLREEDVYRIQEQISYAITRLGGSSVE